MSTTYLENVKQSIAIWSVNNARDLHSLDITHRQQTIKRISHEIGYGLTDVSQISAAANIVYNAIIKMKLKGVDFGLNLSDIVSYVTEGIRGK